MLAIALNVDPVELIAGDGEIQMSDTAVLSRSFLRKVLRGDHKRADLSDSTPRNKQQTITHDQDNASAVDAALQPGAIEVDARVATQLGIPLRAVLDAAYTLWDHPLTEERDVRASAYQGVDSRRRQAHRGHITRHLVAELRAELARNGVIDQAPNQRNNDT
ncbi:hypothetical protein [Amycolatopsis sp. GM8]|uniref:hypothetical protein n=1 Tax=Amycolatopsis sp. GM8 TaxID=2896530 RepID=UPI001F235BF0